MSTVLDLIPVAVVCVIAVFLMLFGDQVSAKRRQQPADPQGDQ